MFLLLKCKIHKSRNLACLAPMIPPAFNRAPDIQVMCTKHLGKSVKGLPCTKQVLGVLHTSIKQGSDIFIKITPLLPEKGSDPYENACGVSILLWEQGSSLKKSPLNELNAQTQRWARRIPRLWCENAFLTVRETPKQGLPPPYSFTQYIFVDALRKHQCIKEIHPTLQELTVQWKAGETDNKQDKKVKLDGDKCFKEEASRKQRQRLVEGVQVPTLNKEVR